MNIQWDEGTGLAYELSWYFQDCPKADVNLQQRPDMYGDLESCLSCRGTMKHKQILLPSRRKLTEPELKSAQRSVRKKHYS